MEKDVGFLHMSFHVRCVILWHTQYSIWLSTNIWLHIVTTAKIFDDFFFWDKKKTNQIYNLPFGHLIKDITESYETNMDWSVKVIEVNCALSPFETSTMASLI